MTFNRRVPSFTRFLDNMNATPSLTPGTAVTAGANNADGSAVAALSALPFDCELLVIGIGGFNTNTALGKVLLDILVDPAGGTSWASLIDDLLAGFTAISTASISVPLWYKFPLYIKAGSTLGLRARTAHTADITTGNVVLQAYGGNRNPQSWWCGQKVESIGITAASSKGTDFTPVSGSFSSWANFGSPLSAHAHAMQFACQGSDAASLGTNYNVEFGVGSTKIAPTMVKIMNTTELGWSTPLEPHVSLPSGAQLQVRGIANGTAEVLDVAAYAVQ